jgi:hypothetical protein
MLSTSYKILPNNLFSRLSPYVDKIIGDHQCGIRRNRWTTDQNCYICLALERKLDYNETLHQLFIDFKKVYDSIRREVLYNCLMVSGVPISLVTCNKICLNDTYNKVHIGKYLSVRFLIKIA